MNRIISYILALVISHLWAEGCLFARSGLGDLSEQLDYIVDAAGRETLESITARPASDWKSARGHTVNFGFRSEVFWFRVALPACPRSDISRVLELAYPLLDDIRFWEMIPGNQPVFHQMGDKQPFAQRPIEHIHFGLPVGCAEGTFVILRVQSSSSIQIPLNLWEREDFLATGAQEMMPQFFYFGAMLVMALYNLFVFLSVRKLTYLLYVLFTLSFSCFQAGISGMGFCYVWPNLPVLNDFVIDKSLNWVTIFALGFAALYMPIHKNFPRLYRFSLFFIGLVAVYHCGSYLLPYRIAIKCTIGLMTVAIFLGASFCVKSILHRQREGYFYIVAWCSFLAGGLILAMNKLGIAPRNLLTENVIQVASMMEALLLSFALADQLNILRKNLALSHSRLQFTLDSIERMVSEKTQNIRSILDTVQQGILTVRGPRLLIEGEYSPYTMKLLESNQLSGTSVKASLIDKLDLTEDQRRRIVAALQACLEDGLIAFELNASQFPHELRIHTQQGLRDLVVDWTPILHEEGAIDRFLIVLRDVTDWKKLESYQLSQNEMLQKLQQMTQADPQLLRNFLAHADKILRENILVAQRLQPADFLKNLFIDVHTLKGESRSLGLDDLSEACHILEDAMTGMRNGEQPLTQADLQNLLSGTQEILASYQKIHKEKLKSLVDDGDVVMRLEKLGQWKKDLSQLKDYPAVASILEDIHAIVFIPFEHFQLKVERWTRRIAQDLGRAEPQLAISSGVPYFDSRVSDGLDKIFIHLLQNALSHGLHSAEVQGTISIRFALEDDRVCVYVRDSGRGLDQTRIQRRASQLGLVSGESSLTPAHMTELVLTSGFSSLEAVHSYAGRGVGLDAVQSLVKQLNGEMRIAFFAEREPGFTPFELIIDLPASLFPGRA